MLAKASEKFEGENAYVIDAYRNKRISVKLIQHDVIHNTDTVPEMFWKTCAVIVQNIVDTDADGFSTPQRMTIDYELSKEFSTLDAGLKHYRDVLKQWTDCVVTEDKVVEKGNELKVDPNVPIVPKENAEEFGDW